MTLEELVGIVLQVKPSLTGQKVGEADSLVDDLGLDSLDLIQLGRRIQRHGGIPFVMQDWLEASIGTATPVRFGLGKLLEAVNEADPDAS